MTQNAATPVAISVVIAARNEAATLGACLQALTAQQFGMPYEILVVENASTDITASIAETFGCRILHERRIGQVNAKQRGVSAARGRIVAVLDADCIPGPQWLSAVHDGLNGPAQTGVAAVTSYYRYDARMPWWGRVYVAISRECLVAAYRRCFRGEMPFVLGGNVAFRREHFESMGGYSEAFGIAETELGLARKLRAFGAIRHAEGMAVTTSSRRFREGVWSFTFHYKLAAYLWPYLVASMTPRMRSRSWKPAG